ncbi:MAG: DDE-type integrase/transposase/recombinase [Deltaproteobacteria bacterium]|nr:MAG: DDE-type integrase/transposase/recombinase [Deltaproteobacteria bacterium]
MMQAAAFDQWCHRLGLGPATRAYLAHLRASPPVRRVQGRAQNVSGTYASRKMGVTIQFESHKVELWAIYAMEYDAQVLEYFDQSDTLTLTYQSPSGRTVVVSHTPDFLVLRQDSVGFEEWKQEERLRALAVSHPGRYQHDPAGRWCCPPGEEAAARLGLSYHVRSSAGLHPTYIRNLIFLEDYFFAYHIAPDLAVQILEAVEAQPGLSLAALLQTRPHITVDAVYALIARGGLYVDLCASPLKEHPHVQLYPDQTTAEAHVLLLTSRTTPPWETPSEQVAVTQLVALHANAPLLWDGRRWTVVNVGNTLTTLLPEVGPLLQIETRFFLHLVNTQTITVLEPPQTLPLVSLSHEVHRHLAEAGPDALAVANRRFRLVEAYQQRQREFYAGTPPRTIRDWVARFRDAEARCGCGYIGLLPHTTARGNRTPKAPEAARRLLDEVIDTLYARSKQQHAQAVYVAYQDACRAAAMQPLSKRTFYRRLQAHTGPALTTKRQGTRAAYPEQPWYWELTPSTPRHGDRPWEVAHLDHTQLDIELVSSFGTPLGRPWVTFLIDAYARRVLACYLTFDPPSYRAAMMALRVCVRRQGRLPQTLIVDGGKEFHSRYFDSVLACYYCTKKTRPWAQPRYGAVIERLFGTTTTAFIHNLLGNTQASKVPRQMTNAVDPKRQAVWQLPDLYTFLCEWAYDIYDQREHPALGQSPRETWAVGLAYGGERAHRRILYDEAFRLATLPSPPRGTALVHPSQGIKVHYLSYWHDVFRLPDVVRTRVPVRYDPFDISVVYAYVHERWVECVTSSYGQFHGHSERELLLITAELRARNRKSHITTPITATRLAAFLADIEAHEAVLLQRLRDQETRAVLQIIDRGRRAPTPGEVPVPLETSQEAARPVAASTGVSAVDLATLQVYEEYR